MSVCGGGGGHRISKQDPSTHVVLMLVRRLWRWPNIDPLIGGLIVFTALMEQHFLSCSWTQPVTNFVLWKFEKYAVDSFSNATHNFNQMKNNLTLYLLIKLKIIKCLPICSCVSLPRPTTSSGYECIILVYFDTKHQFCNS